MGKTGVTAADPVKSSGIQSTLNLIKHKLQLELQKVFASHTSCKKAETFFCLLMCTLTAFLKKNNNVGGKGHKKKKNRKSLEGKTDLRRVQ